MHAPWSLERLVKQILKPAECCFWAILLNMYKEEHKELLIFVQYYVVLSSSFKCKPSQFSAKFRERISLCLHQNLRIFFFFFLGGGGGGGKKILSSNIYLVEYQDNNTF